VQERDFGEIISWLINMLKSPSPAEIVLLLLSKLWCMLTI